MMIESDFGSAWHGGYITGTSPRYSMELCSFADNRGTPDSVYTILATLQPVLNSLRSWYDHRGADSMAEASITGGWEGVSPVTEEYNLARPRVTVSA